MLTMADDEGAGGPFLISFHVRVYPGLYSYTQGEQNITAVTKMLVTTQAFLVLSLSLFF